MSFFEMIMLFGIISLELSVKSPEKIMHHILTHRAADGWRIIHGDFSL